MAYCHSHRATMVRSAHAAPSTPSPPDIHMADTGVAFTPVHPPCKSSRKPSKSTFETSVEAGKAWLGA